MLDDEDKYRRRRRLRLPLLTRWEYGVTGGAIMFLLLWAFVIFVCGWGQEQQGRNSSKGFQKLQPRRGVSVRASTTTMQTKDMGPQGAIMELRQQQKQKQKVAEMSHENLFLKTIRDCLPQSNNDNNNNSNKCKTFVPESKEAGGNGEKLQRVALIAPPGSIALAVHKRLRALASEYNAPENNHGRVEPKMDMIRTSHVPPYGYGKSHGLTKIVKISPRPLFVQVVDALQGVLGPTQSTDNITLEDLQVGLLQILRFHCRLSHVAAHTASLTVHSQTLADDAALEQVLRNYLLPGGPMPRDVKQDATKVANGDNTVVGAETEEIATNILARLSSQTSAVGDADIMTVLDRVLLDEMKRTKDMSIWPCPSFWEVPPPLQMSDLSKQLAQALSPNCDDPYVSCFVQKDKCEAAGNPVCKK